MMTPTEWLRYQDSWEYVHNNLVGCVGETLQHPSLSEKYLRNIWDQIFSFHVNKRTFKKQRNPAVNPADLYRHNMKWHNTGIDTHHNPYWHHRTYRHHRRHKYDNKISEYCSFWTSYVQFWSENDHPPCNKKKLRSCPHYKVPTATPNYPKPCCQLIVQDRRTVSSRERWLQKIREFYERPSEHNRWTWRPPGRQKMGQIQKKLMKRKQYGWEFLMNFEKR